MTTTFSLKQGEKEQAVDPLHTPQSIFQLNTDFPFNNFRFLPYTVYIALLKDRFLMKMLLKRAKSCRLFSFEKV